MTTENNQTYVKTIKNLDSRKAKSGEDYYEVTYTDDTKDRFWRDHMAVVKDAKERGLPVKVGRAKKDGYWNVTSVEVSSLAQPKEDGISDSKDDGVERQESIERQVSLKCACEIANEDSTIDQILDNATRMYTWIHNHN